MKLEDAFNKEYVHVLSRKKIGSASFNLELVTHLSGNARAHTYYRTKAQYTPGKPSTVLMSTDWLQHALYSFDNIKSGTDDKTLEKFLIDRSEEVAMPAPKYVKKRTHKLV